MTEKRFTPRLENNRIVWITDTVEEKILFGEDTVELLNMLHEENQHFKRLAYGNEEQLLKVMSYLHDKYYDLWEEVNKECYNG